ncbi:hypothetical protein J0H58_21270 [bacterium]|nr:hypothetical protein [bacterium]
MSTDLIRRAISRELDSVRVLQARGLPPVACAMAWVEGTPPPVYTPRFSPLAHAVDPTEAVMTDALFHPCLGAAPPYLKSFHWGSGGSYATLYSGLADRFDPWGITNQWFAEAEQGPLAPDPTQDAIRAIQELGGRLIPIVEGLPADLVERLGFDRSDRPTDWTRVLFHLGWHFPAHGVEVTRGRILSAGERRLQDYLCPESNLQLGLSHVTPDVFPGVAVSRLADGCDFLSATGHALRLILEAVEGGERGAKVGPRTEFAELRDEFERAGRAIAAYPDDLEAEVLRVSNSFRTPPATEWAHHPVGDRVLPSRYYVLSVRDTDRVVCAVRGGSSVLFADLANRAGALLPSWPADRYPALLGDACAFARYARDLPFPWIGILGDVWNRGMVTDHRGNVERWLGVVFGILMARKLEFLELEIGPGWERPGSTTPKNALVTLRGMNLFAASARAIEIAGPVLLPPPAPVATSHPAARTPRPRRWLDDLLGVLADAAAGLRGFEETDRPFTIVAGEWNAWRARVAGLGVGDAEVALRGELDRVPSAPHRHLPGDLSDLWLRVKTWGPGMTATWPEFAASPHSTARRGLAQELASWLDRLRRLFLYLGVELPPPGTGNEPDPAPRRGAPGVTTPGDSGGRLRCDEADRSVYLDGRRIAGEVDLTLFRFFRVLAEEYPDAIPFRLIQRRVAGLGGKHPTRDLRDRLPLELSRLVTSGRAGYSLKLPAPK